MYNKNTDYDYNKDRPQIKTPKKTPKKTNPKTGRNIGIFMFLAFAALVLIATLFVSSCKSDKEAKTDAEIENLDATAGETNGTNNSTDVATVGTDSVNTTVEGTDSSQSAGTTETAGLDENSVYVDIEEMPLFSAKCSIEESSEARNKCSNKRLGAFIGRHFEYPDHAMDMNTQGKVIIEFIVGKDGNMSDFRIAKDIGHGCGKEALRVAKKLGTWVPGKVQGKPVKVKMQVPFQLAL